MDWVTAVTAAMSTAAPFVLAYVALVKVPSVQHSYFRHSLWALRDDVMDDVLAGRLRRDERTAMVLALTTIGIENAKRHTLLAAWVNVRHARHLVDPDMIHTIVLGGEGGPERERLAEYLTRYRRISERHLYSGAPSGWAYWTFHRLRATGRLVRQAVDTEIVEAPAREKELAVLRPEPC